MFVVDYILARKREGKNKKLSELSVNLAESQRICSSNLTQGWFLGRADGAPFSRIILSNSTGDEIMLVLKLSSEAEENEIREFLAAHKQISITALKEKNSTLSMIPIVVPIKVFDSELESIRSWAGHVC
jgi:hypothetical protein